MLDLPRDGVLIENRRITAAGHVQLAKAHNVEANAATGLGMLSTLGAKHRENLGQERTDKRRERKRGEEGTARGERGEEEKERKADGSGGGREKESEGGEEAGGRRDEWL